MVYMRIRKLNTVSERITEKSKHLRRLFEDERKKRVIGAKEIQGELASSFDDRMKRLKTWSSRCKQDDAKFHSTLTGKNAEDSTKLRQLLDKERSDRILETMNHRQVVSSALDNKMIKSSNIEAKNLRQELICSIDNKIKSSRIEMKNLRQEVFSAVESYSKKVNGWASNVIEETGRVMKKEVCKLRIMIDMETEKRARDTKTIRQDLTSFSNQNSEIKNTMVAVNGQVEHAQKEVAILREGCASRDKELFNSESQVIDSRSKLPLLRMDIPSSNKLMKSRLQQMIASSIRLKGAAHSNAALNFGILMLVGIVVTKFVRDYAWPVLLP